MKEWTAGNIGAKGVRPQRKLFLETDCWITALKFVHVTRVIPSPLSSSWKKNWLLL